jgi:hypothetical protein
LDNPEYGGLTLEELVNKLIAEEEEKRGAADIGAGKDQDSSKEMLKFPVILHYDERLEGIGNNHTFNFSSYSYNDTWVHWRKF